MTKTVIPRTNGDRVQPYVDRAKHLLTEGAKWAREHPDEVVVAGLPMVLAVHLSIKYDMDWFDHVLITQTGQELGLLALKAYRDWKTRPARPSLEKVI